MSDTATAQKFEDGDIFRWHYKPEVQKRKEETIFNAYHCRSCIAIAEDGRLWDTYWSSHGDQMPLNPNDIVLTFVGNPKSMTIIYPAERVFYRPEDIVNMQHANNSGAPVYAKAPRDPETMKAYFTEQIQKTERDIEWAHRRIAECKQSIARVDRGETDGSFATYVSRN